MKNYYKDNPDARIKNSEAVKKYYEENPEARKKASDKMKKYYEDNPDARIKNIERIKNYYKENPEEIRKNAKARQKNTTPFNIIKDGIVKETFIYLFDAQKYLQQKYNIKTRIRIGNVLRGTQKSSHDLYLNIWNKR